MGKQQHHKLARRLPKWPPAADNVTPWKPAFVRKMNRLMRRVLTGEGWGAMSYPRNDTQFDDVAIEGVKGNGKNGWTIALQDQGSFYVPESSPIIPRVGMTARLYPGGGLGRFVRGLFLDGQKVFYLSDAQQRAKWAKEQRENDRKRRDKYEQERPDHDKRIASLPEPFRQRIARFRANNPDFGWQNEAYELFCCEQAVLIANELVMVEAIDAWKAMDYADQKRRVPIDDGHSGNTFGCACYLAKLYLECPGDVPKAHGAMCLVVGCESYGCMPRTKDPK